MRRNLFTMKGEPSFNGIDPKTKTWGNHEFGWHHDEGLCVSCNKKYTHYALHRRYKFTRFIEKYEEQIKEKWLEEGRLWCCGEACWKRIVWENIMEQNIPLENAEKALTGKK